MPPVAGRGPWRQPPVLSGPHLPRYQSAALVRHARTHPRSVQETPACDTASEAHRAQPDLAGAPYLTASAKGKSKVDSLLVRHI
jgi:hypothetical protein